MARIRLVTPEAKTFPPKLNHYDEFNVGLAKLEQLRSDYGAVLSQLTALGKRVTGTLDMNAVAADVVARGASRAASRNRQAVLDEVLGTAARAAELDAPDLPEQIVAARERLKALEAAIEIQQRTVESSRLEASRKLCDDIAPQYREIVGKMGRALAVVAEAYQAYTALTRALNADGVVWGSLNTMPMSFVEGGMHSLAGEWLREAAREGFIDRGIVPEDFKSKR